MIQMLRSDAGKRLSSLASDLDVSERTIYRDLKILSELGFVIKSDGTPPMYRLGPNGSMPNLHLSRQEHWALGILWHNLESRIGQPGLSTLRDAVSKVMAATVASSSSNAKDQGQYDCISVSPASLSTVPIDHQLFQLFCQAIQDSRTCVAEYTPDGLSSATSVRIEPVHLHFWNHSWYLFASVPGDGQIKTFRLSGFRRVAMLKDVCKSKHKFDVHEYLGNAWGIDSSAEDVRVVVRFSSGVAGKVSDLTWHHTQTTQPMPNGEVEFTFVVSGIEEISHWIASFGDQVRVICPDSLRELVCNRAIRVCMLAEHPLDVPVVHIADADSSIRHRQRSG